jgi:hypothetical protein
VRTPRITDCSGWRILAAWLLLLPAIASAAETAKKQPALDPAAWNCELILGKHIKTLSLVDEHGQCPAYRSRGASLLLPPGKYTIQQIDLQGGYSCSLQNFGHPEKPLILAPGKPYRFDIRGPLMPHVTAERAGRLLTMNYQLLDADGRKYLNREHSAKPPQFAVYQGDRLIGSGTFEYG